MIDHIRNGQRLEARSEFIDQHGLQIEIDMDIGDYTGIPINEAGRLRAESWHPDQLDLPENLCRPHPSANAPHKWSGFSTGHWERNTLVYTTTHLKEAYLTRTGVPKSERATVTTRVHRYGNLMTIVFIINDPLYLTAPYIRASSWIFDPTQIIPPFPCEISPDGTIIGAGKVPSFMASHGSFADEQRLRGLTVGFAGGEQTKDLDFAIAERADPPARSLAALVRHVYA